MKDAWTILAFAFLFATDDCCCDSSDALDDAVTALDLDCDDVDMLE